MRKTTPKRKPLLPDPRFGDTLVTRFVNNMMVDGKKSTAYEVFYGAMDIVSQRTNENGIEIFKKALANITPQVEVKSRRVGGATFQIPQEVRPERKVAVAIRWMLLYSRKRNEKSMAQKLAGEIMAASREEGAAFKKKEDTHRMAEANKAFSHFRF
jgi:small subunit ribosomal protein S7